MSAKSLKIREIHFRIPQFTFYYSLSIDFTSTTSVPAVSGQKDDNENSSTIVVIAASVAAVLLVVLIVLAVVLLLRRRKRGGHGKGNCHFCVTHDFVCISRAF